MDNNRLRALALALCCSGIVLTGTASAQARPYLYDGEDTQIFSLSLDGVGFPRQVADLSSQFASLGPWAYQITDLKADASRVYWATAPDSAPVSTGAIGFVNRSGGRSGVLAQFDLDVKALAVTSRFIYFGWSQRQAAGGPQQFGLGRMNLDGSGVAAALVTGLEAAPTSVAVHGEYVYWSWLDDTESGWIGRARSDGTGVTSRFISEHRPLRHVLAGPGAIAAGKRYLYWAYQGYVGRGGFDGTHVNPRFRRVYGGDGAVAITRDHLWWGDFAGGNVGRMDLNGSDVFASFYKSGISGAIAVPDDPLPRPSHKCRIPSTAPAGPLVARCRGVSGKVTVIIASVLNRRAAAPAGTLSSTARVRRVRRGQLVIPRAALCPTRFDTGEYRIFFVRHGAEQIGDATVHPRRGRRC